MVAAEETRKFEYRRPYLYPKQKAAFFNNARYSYCEASTKAGKDQPLDALISTPSGWKKMGDIIVGDIIHGLNGNTKVIGVYPQGKKPIYRILFSDGSETRAGKEHLWHVENSCGKKRILTTQDLIDRPAWDFKRCYVPQHSAVEYNKKEKALIDPWLLGYLIGDACFTAKTLTLSIGLNEQEQIAMCANAIQFYGCGLVYNCNSDWYIRKPEGKYKNPIIQAIKEYGLWGCNSFTKFIPDQIKFGCIETRLEFVRGLLDADGWVNKHGQPVLEQCSQKLSNDFVHVMRSLGAVVKTCIKTSATGKPVYCNMVSYHAPSSLFKMSRKANKCKPPKKPVKKTFKKIEFIGYEKTQCIEVDADDSLYLTDDFIATHNTHACIVWIVEKALLEGGPNKNYWWVAPIRDQAKIAYRRILNASPKGMIKKNESELYIEFPNGARIYFKSGEKPDNLYGEDVYGAVLDEASRCRYDSWIALRSTLTATRGQVRLIANVIGKNNWFYIECRAVQRGRPNSHYSKITALDAVDAGVLDPEEIEDAERLYEKRPDVFRQLYMAEALDDDLAFMNSDSVEAAMTRTGIEARGAKIIGADPSQGRNDPAAFALRQGQVMHWVQEHEGMDEIGFKAHLTRLIISEKPDKVFVDGTGFGITIVKDMWEQNSKFKNIIVPVNFASRKTLIYPDEYYNKRVEMWGEWRKWLEDDDDPAQMPDIPALHVEATCINSKPHSSGLLLLEAKEDLEARGYPSPNMADACALTFAEPVQIYNSGKIPYSKTQRNRVIA